MGDARISPVQQEVAAVANEHLAIVKIVVLNRLRKAIAAQLVAHLPNARHVLEQPHAFVRRELRETVD